MTYDELALELVDMTTVDEQTIPNAIAEKETYPVLSGFDPLDLRLLRVIRNLDR